MSLSGGRKRITIVFAVLVTLVAAVLVAVSWASSGSGGQGRPARWNPRQSTPNAAFVGDHVCAQCHKKEFASYSNSAMGMAAESVAESRVLSANPTLSFKNGPYSYTIKRQGNQSLYTVSNGKDSLTVPILYAFGQGKAGQTYVLQYEGQLIESLVSYYKEVKGLDLTIGASRDVPPSIKEALGKPMSENESKDCFSCHATEAIEDGKLKLEKAVPGIRCEACHGPGAAHVDAIDAGQPGRGLIYNPKRLSGDELTQDFCATCHRALSDFQKLQSLKINNVRFQPYRIFYSNCYSDDARIKCTACHNPHEPVKMDSAYYDTKCLACHSQSKGEKADSSPPGSAVSCKVASKDCVSCHMQKVGPPQAHFNFTDHYIRIVRDKENYPN